MKINWLLTDIRDASHPQASTSSDDSEENLFCLFIGAS